MENMESMEFKTEEKLYFTTQFAKVAHRFLFFPQPSALSSL
jgi:hypothetical protein